MDFGEVLRQNASALWAVVGFAVAQLVQLWRDGVADGRLKSAEDRADRRSIRDAKLLRLRASFEVVIRAAWGLQTARVETVMGYADESDEDKTKRINDLLTLATDGINHARSRLALESDADDVLEAFEKIYVAFFNYMSAARAKPQELDALERGKYMKQDRETIERGTADLESLVRKKLAKLEGDS
jgi:hypothetical protein